MFRAMGIAVVIVALIASAAGGQDAGQALTEWGDPDLEGTWLSANTTGQPMQRPVDDSDDALLRELIDAGALEATLINEGVPQAPWLLARQQALAEWRRMHPEWSPLVVAPEDGRLPPLTAVARARAATQWRSSSQTTGPWNSAAEFGPSERCISRGVIGSMLPSFDYHGIQIVQAPGVVVIRNEAIHEARVIALDDHVSLSPRIRGYMGDSRGHWENATLVVETTHTNGRTGAHFTGNETPTSERLRLVERFARLSDDTIDYQITVDDPETWEVPWTVRFPLTRNPDYVMSEYACHEGNYALRHMLSAARAAERATRR